MAIVHDSPRSGESSHSDEQTDKALWMRLADRLYGIPPGESLRLISGSCCATIRAAGEGFVHIHFSNPAVSPPEAETTDLRSSKNARLLASWGFGFAPGEEERTAWFAEPPKGIDRDAAPVIPITRQMRRHEERLARKRGV